MAYDVKVKIDLAMPVGNIGMGIPLILLENAETAVAYTECSSIAAVEAAGFKAESDVHKAAKLIFRQEHAPKQVAVCAVTSDAADALADDKLVEKGWRQLIVVNSGSNASAVTELIPLMEDLENKVLFVGLETDDSTSITVNDISRTVLFYCDATADAPVPVAALVGETAGREPGSFTYKNLILKGILPQDLTDLEIEAIHNKGGITYVQKAGDNVTSEGKVAGGEYIDIIDSKDYIVQQLRYKTQKLLNSAAKVPYDNNGIALLESVAVDVLQRAYNNGMIAVTAEGKPDYFVEYALREDTDAADRAVRHYAGGKFGFALAGAIHDVYIVGEITV